MSDAVLPNPFGAFPNLLGPLPEPAWRAGADFVFLTPVQNVTMEQRRLDFHDGTSLFWGDRPTQRLFNQRRVAPGFRTLSWFAPHTLTTDECVIRVRMKARKYEIDQQRAAKKIDRIITALRLLGAYPYASSTLALHPRLQNSARTCYLSELTDRFPTTSIDDCKLDRRATRKLRIVHFNLGRVSKKTRIAIGRFNRALSRESDEDRIIDLWIGLEALFSPGVAGEHTFRTSLRIMQFLGPEDRKRRYELLLDSYDLRSDVIHGRPMRNVSQRLHLDQTSLIESTLECLRDTLAGIVEEDPKFDAASLDEAIIKGER